MTIDQFLRELWNTYTRITPSAQAILNLFTERGETVENDHIAIRTFNDPRVNIDSLSRPFIEKGYLPVGEYFFTEKKLFARHFENPGDPALPKIFISELQLESFSPGLQQIIHDTLRDTSRGIYSEPNLVLRGRLWGLPGYTIYETLRQESEYAAWVYVYGFCVNHFTVLTNALRTFDSLKQVNDFLELHGFVLNASGGLIKGEPAQLLEQSSILADKAKCHFREGDFTIPGCYYEFARRYPDAEGKLYQGFIAASADKIFESTDRRLSEQTIKK